MYCILKDLHLDTARINLCDGGGVVHVRKWRVSFYTRNAYLSRTVESILTSMAHIRSERQGKPVIGTCLALWVLVFVAVIVVLVFTFSFWIHQMSIWGCWRMYWFIENILSNNEGCFHVCGWLDVVPLSNIWKIGTLRWTILIPSGVTMRIW